MTHGFKHSLVALLFAILSAHSILAAERGSETVRVAVASKSFGFLDTWAVNDDQKAEVVPFLRKYFGLDEATAAEAHRIHSKLIIDDVNPRAQASKFVLDQRGKPDLPLEPVAAASVVEAVLRERR